jgi:bacteriocin biosynthesis cyclodehydratase domain-containing protein
MMAAVGLLDGYHDHREVARAIGPDWAHWLLAVLDGQDALTDGPATAALGPHVHVVGAGPLARAVAIRLAATGAGRRIERRDHADHLDLADRPDIVVLAGSAIEADRVAASRLTAAGISHLIVRAGFGRAVLGPFVLPGVTSCLRCLDLNRRRGDPAWPLVAFQLAQCDAPTDRLLIGWLAALTAIEVATWRSGRLPDTSSATLTYDRAEAADTRRAWPVHPRCDCRAAARYRGPGDLAG